MEAREAREPDKEGEKDAAEEPESASEDATYEYDENDDFDGDADWSEYEAGKEYDVFETYNFVWSEGWQEDPKAFEGGSMDIYGSAEQNQRDEPFRCTADFEWRDFRAQFTCIYRPETATFTDFKAKRKTLDGGMDELQGVTVHMWEEIWSWETGERVGDRKEVKDERDHLFLFVQMDFGFNGFESMISYVYGKKVVEDGSGDNVALTRSEKERLRLPMSEY